MKSYHSKLQHKLIQIFLLTSTLPLVIVAIITIWLMGRMAFSEARQKINNNLDIATAIYNNVNEDLKYIVRDQNRRVYRLLEAQQTDLLTRELKEVVQEKGLDFFMLTDAQGRVILSLDNPQAKGEDLSSDFCIQEALKGNIHISAEVLAEKDLERLGILQKAKIPGLLPSRGLVIKAVLPIINKEEKIIGTMSAGYLLNNNRKIILDKIKAATGAVACIFQDGRRICTTLPAQNGAYALGEYLESVEKIKQHLSLTQNQSYITRAQLLKEWYVVNYSLIYDCNKKIIGILALGIPEASTFALRNNLMRIFIFAVLLSIALSFIFGFLKSNSILKAIRELRFGIEAFARDDLSHRININTKDEIEELANFFNKMMQQVKADKQRLREQERLAAMGRMANAISHELKNIFSEIQTSAYYLKTKISKNFPALSNSFQDIENSVIGANDVLKNILRYNYPRKLVLSQTNINSIVEDVLGSLNLSKIFKDNNIEITKDLDSSVPAVKLDALQIKEVISNLVTNAAQAMPEGGRLSVVTKKYPAAIKLEVTDTGTGISAQALENLFTPFFTTKGRGLGLGLCISKEIIEAHQGSIEVKTEIKRGSTFIVSFPLN